MSQWSRITVVAVAVVGLAAGCSDPPQVTVNEADPGAAVGPESLPNGITVSGEGEVMGAPDTLAVTYGVSLKRDSVDAAVNDAANAANVALEAAKAQGVAEADIQTPRLLHQPRVPLRGRRSPDPRRVPASPTPSS